LTSSKPKVLFLPRWYPNRYDPMPGLFIERHARSVAGLADIAVLYVHPDDTMKGKSFETDISQDEELFQVKIYFRTSQTGIPGFDSFRNLCRLLKYHRKGLKIIKKEFGKPGLLHVNVLTRLGIIALLYKWLTGTPYVITEHWTRYLPHMDNFRGWMRKRLTRIVVRQAAAVMPVTDNLRKAMERHGLLNSNYVIIPNVVDMNVFDIADIPSGSQKKQIIHVSCFEDKQKNISGILRVLKKLSEKRSDWECHMIGEGIHYDILVHQAEESGLKDQFVHFHGLKEGAELARMMAEAGFQVMFSRFENLPVVILESYACGVPVLSTDVGGIREHLTDELGILIPSENEEKLLKKLDYMLDHYKEYKKEKLRAYAQAHFSKEVIGRQLREIYTASL